MSSRKKGKIATSGGDALESNPFASLGSIDTASETSRYSAPVKPAKSHTTTKAFIGKRSSAVMGRVEIRREKAGRGGKTVTTLQAFATHLPQSQLERLCCDLKKHCACGGTRKERTIELQGDVKERAFAFLQQRGFAPVRSGG